MLLLGFLLLSGAFAAGSPPEEPRNPENVTVQVIDAKTVEVSWSTTWKNVERYDVTYNPTENRVVSQAAGNSRSVILRELRPDTQYQVTVTAVVGGKNYRSRRLVFRTAEDPGAEGEAARPEPTRPSKPRKTHPATPEVVNPDPTAVGSKYTPQTSTTVRGVEIGLVLLALVVWIVAISLFFHRWGKIRMLLPYQPDYKTQQSLKVPGTGTSIVSGCAGNPSTQGHQEGPGCVQHLRWSSRYFDEPSTAKKTSPGRRGLKPRVSSAVFPASPPFLCARTSLECESPRTVRRARSRGHFPPETIPLCQVNRPRSESPENVITVTVPAIASEVNEKAPNRKPGEVKVSDRRPDGGRRTDGGEWTRRKDGPGLPEGEPPEEPPLFREASPPRPESKPRRYDRSSLRKQKFRLCDDREAAPCQHVPIREFEDEPPEPADANRKPVDEKTAEMRRKTFLRKVSLQDTYLNYNQDYWLDFKKSLRFHKSIDLGYFQVDAKDPKHGGRTPEALREERSPPVAPAGCEPPPAAAAGDLRKSDSDPVIFPKCSCSGSDAEEPPAAGHGGASFFLPSDENIPLFSERNGRIETDFDVLNAFDGRPWSPGSHPSAFYEIKLADSDDSDRFPGEEGFLEDFSGDSDVFLNETEPLRVSSSTGEPD